jgi:hypothetical protein
MKLKMYSLPLALAAIASLTPFAAYSQAFNSGSISGTVADTTGAVIPGATVTATATATNITKAMTAGKDGTFSFKDLPIGMECPAFFEPVALIETGNQGASDGTTEEAYG